MKSTEKKNLPAPASARAKAILLPIPRVQPEIAATFPESEKI